MAISSLAAGANAQEFERSKSEITKVLREIAAQPLPEAAKPLENQRARALQRLQSYRYLSGLEWRDMRLSDLLNSFADAAARLCQAAGKIAHQLPNPGLSSVEYSRGVIGIRGSNLAFGYPEIDLLRAVEGFIDDSDGANITQMGHRAWCLNPELQLVGFGLRGRYAAMMCRDESGRKNGIRYVRYPGPGYYPISFMAASRPWSIHFDWRKYGRSELGRAELKMFRLDEDFMDLEEVEI
ncbi:MAG: CAP domain-containing protein, partial [Planctomycetota bacterium]